MKKKNEEEEEYDDDDDDGRSTWILRLKEGFWSFFESFSAPNHALRKGHLPSSSEAPASRLIGLLA